MDVELATIPRAVVCQGLRGLRLPLDLVESVARLSGVGLDERWGPAVAFEGFEAEAKRLAGSLLGDHELVDEGVRQRARAEELHRSSQMQVLSELTRARAEARVGRSRRAADEQRQAIAEAARQVESEARQERHQGRQRVRRQAERRQQEAERADQQREEVVEEVARSARRRQLAEEAAALHSEQEAAEAEAEVEALQSAEERLRATRRGGT